MKLLHFTFPLCLAFLCAAPALADPGIQKVPLGYQQITSTDTAVSLTVPTGATSAVIETEAQAARYRDDGAAPTTTVGMPLAVGEKLEYSGTLSKVRIIAATTGAIINVLYYR